MVAGVVLPGAEYLAVEMGMDGAEARATEVAAVRGAVVAHGACRLAAEVRAVGRHVEGQYVPLIFIALLIFIRFARIPAYVHLVATHMCVLCSACVVLLAGAGSAVRDVAVAPLPTRRVPLVASGCRLRTLPVFIQPRARLFIFCTNKY